MNTRGYWIVDADAHVHEPTDLWQQRVPAKFRQRAPKVVPLPAGGEGWSFEDGQRISPIGVTAAAGRSFPQYVFSGMRHADMRPGAWEPKARLLDMQIDGIDASVLYPSVALAGAKAYSQDTELQLACVRAYNDWLADFCAYAPDRLHGLTIIPTSGIEDALTELRRGARLGHRGPVISAWPNGTMEPKPQEDDLFWAACQEMDAPVAVHAGSFDRSRAAQQRQGPRSPLETLLEICTGRAGAGLYVVVCDFIFRGILDRFPRLKLLLVEGGIGWIPFFLEQTDDNFIRHRFWTGLESLPMMPSDYFKRQIYNTFQIDTVGIANLDRLAADKVMWSTDYPHTGADWPNSRVTLERNFKGLPEKTVKMLINENAVKLYKIPEPKSGA
jgi:predicted TIM-barrel fold metal-dependent hydrolase